MKFVIKGNADKIYKNLEEFITEAERVWEEQTKIAVEKLKPKLAILPIKPDFDFPPLSLAQIKQDSKTVYLFTNIGGDNKGITGKMFNILYKPAQKKMIKNLEAFLKDRGLKVKVSMEKQ